MPLSLSIVWHPLSGYLGLALPHEVGGGSHGSVAVVPRGNSRLHCRACFTHTAIAPAAGQSARSKAALRGDTAPAGVSHLIAHEPQTARRSRSLFNGPPSRLQQASVHHLRRGTPVTSRYTRYVAIHPIRRGVMPTDRVHCLIDNKLARGFSR